jgi:hypothetical protein
MNPSSRNLQKSSIVKVALVALVEVAFALIKVALIS